MKPSGKSEGVHHRIVENPEGPGKLGALGMGRQAGTQVGDVGLEGIIGVEAHGRHDVWVRLPAHLDLLTLAHEGELALSRGGVYRTRRKGEKRGQGRTTKDPTTPTHPGAAIDLHSRSLLSAAPVPSRGQPSEGRTHEESVGVHLKPAVPEHSEERILREEDGPPPPNTQVGEPSALSHSL